jgi:cyclic beta-1,2-glucan synthetase
MAFARMGEGNKAWRLYHLINPINHTRTCLGVSKYKAEPYVLAADVYAVSPHTGRGGWTWYTGSASWMYRVGIGEILGFKRKDNSFTVDPCIPGDWTGFAMEYLNGRTKYMINVENPDKVKTGTVQITLDGQPLENKSIPLSDDGKQHQVIVTMGAGQ